jgi:hypothetical protein
MIINDRRRPPGRARIKMLYYREALYCLSFGISAKQQQLIIIAALLHIKK